MLYRVSCHSVFPHRSPAEAQPSPWVSTRCTEAALGIVLLHGHGPRAEKQARALPSPTPPTHLFNMYIFSCMQGVLSFLLYYEAVLTLLMDK